MATYEFDLVFALPTVDVDPYDLSDAVLSAGFQDAVIGTGGHGLLAIGVEADGDNAESVILDTARRILDALPKGSALREVGPDLVSLPDVAARLGVSRQTLQQRAMPLPTVGGLYRIDEMWAVLHAATETRGPGHRRPRFDLASARHWFMAGLAARRLNARLVLGELDPRSLRRIDTCGHGPQRGRLAAG